MTAFIIPKDTHLMQENTFYTRGHILHILHMTAFIIPCGFQKDTHLMQENTFYTKEHILHLWHVFHQGLGFRVQGLGFRV
jgi:hypothetical protein